MEYVAPYGSTDPDAHYVDRNTPAAQSGSKVPAKAIENPMREIVGLIVAAGLDPDGDDLAQVAKAIQSRGLNFVHAFGGTANALAATLSVAPDSLYAGLYVEGVIQTTNNAAATLNVNGLGAKAITNSGSALVGGELVAGRVVGFVYDGAAFQIVAAKGSGRLLNVRVFTASGTYTPTPGTQSVVVDVTGGGGGGGGSTLCSSSQASAAGGGGSGSRSIARLTAGFAGVSVTVGAGGTGGAPGSGAGGSGGQSSFGSVVAPGGTGASGVAASVNFAMSGGGGGAVVASGGDLNTKGMWGGYGTSSGTSGGASGAGAPSPFGGGSGDPRGPLTSAGGAGLLGGGGGGAYTGPSGAAGTGGAGGSGIVIIYEYA